MSWSILIPSLITLFCFWDAYKTSGWYSNWWPVHFPLAIGVSASAWLVWWAA